MSVQRFEVSIRDDEWPKLRLKVDQCEFISLYDTAFTNFEVHLSNKLRTAVRDLIQTGDKGAPPPPELRPKERGSGGRRR